MLQEATKYIEQSTCKSNSSNDDEGVGSAFHHSHGSLRYLVSDGIYFFLLQGQCILPLLGSVVLPLI